MTLVVAAAVGATVLLGSAPASAAPAKRQSAGITIARASFNDGRFVLSGTAVPATGLRLSVRLPQSAHWRTVARTRVGRSGHWSAGFHDPRPASRPSVRSFTVRVQQVGSGSAYDSVLTIHTKDPKPTPAPAPIPAPTPTPTPVPVPAPNPTPSPSAAPAGSASSFAFLRVGASGAPARWNPCRPIPYFVNPDRAPAGIGATIAEAFRRISAVNGMSYVESGATGFVLAKTGTTGAVDRGEGIYISFSDAASVPQLAGTVGGMANAASVTVGGGNPRYVAGAVVVDLEANLDPEFTSGWSFGQVLLHELGHAMGLGHVEDPTQLMNPRGWSGGPSDLQAGDRAGLQALLAGGCF